MGVRRRDVGAGQAASRAAGLAFAACWLGSPSIQVSEGASRPLRLNYFVQCHAMQHHAMRCNAYLRVFMYVCMYVCVYVCMYVCKYSV